MTWLENLCNFYEAFYGPLSPEARQSIEDRASVTLPTAPPIIIRRVLKRPVNYARQTGSGYDPSGNILLSVTGKASDFIPERTSFLTQVLCAIELPQPQEFALIPKKLDLKGLFRKDKNTLSRWRVKSTLSSQSVEQIIGLMEETEPFKEGLYTLRLSPLGSQGEQGYSHFLLVETDLFLNRWGNIKAGMDYYPQDSQGAPLSSDEASVKLLSNMVVILQKLIAYLGQSG